MKKYIMIAAALLCFANGVSAQDLGFMADKEFMTTYIWRGMHPGYDKHFAPGASFDIGLNFTSADEKFYAETYFWTYQSLNVPEHYSEYQLTVYVEAHGLHIEWNNYFGDMGEVGVGYTIPGPVPASLTFYTSLYGDDYDETGAKRNYSNYMELGVPYSFGNFELKATFSAVPRKSVYYGNDDGFAVSSMMLEGTYSFELNEALTLPVKAGFGYSPLYQNLLYYASIGLGVAF